MGIARNQLLPALRLPSWVRFALGFFAGVARLVVWYTAMFAAGWYLAEILK